MWRKIHFITIMQDLSLRAKDQAQKIKENNLVIDNLEISLHIEKIIMKKMTLARINRVRSPKKIKSWLVIASFFYFIFLIIILFYFPFVIIFSISFLYTITHLFISSISTYSSGLCASARLPGP